MEIVFIPSKVLFPVKPCFLLCGLNGEAEWARRAIVEALSPEATIIIQDQFIPCPKGRARNLKKTKSFQVSFDWIQDFQERFVLVVELFLFTEDTPAAQVTEDITFACKFAHEYNYEHVAIVVSEQALDSNLLKADHSNVLFFSKDVLKVDRIADRIRDGLSGQYKDGLLKKYRKRMLSNAALFQSAWCCKAYYSFKCAIALEAAKEMGNALKEYHASYSSIVEEGNSSRHFGRQAFCEVARPHSDLLLLRMCQCMLQIGSFKEANSFLRGHLLWFADGVRDRVALVAWQVSILMQYGWVMSNSDHSSAIYHPGVYYAQAVQLSLELMTKASLDHQSIDVVHRTAISAIHHFNASGQYRRSAIERLKYIQLMISLGHADTLSETIDECLSVLRGWDDLSSSLLHIALRHIPASKCIKYHWQLASISGNLQPLQSALKCNLDSSIALEFPDICNGIIRIGAEFDQGSCSVGSRCPIIVKYESLIPLGITTATVELSDKALVEFKFDRGASTIDYIPTSPGKLSITRLTLRTDLLCGLLFKEALFAGTFCMYNLITDS